MNSKKSKCSAEGTGMNLINILSFLLGHRVGDHSPIREVPPAHFLGETIIKRKYWENTSVSHNLQYYFLDTSYM